MIKGQQACKMKGMKRSCVILANALTKSQFMRLAKDSEIYAFERYIDASATPDWTKPAIAWVKDGIDPDKQKCRLSNQSSVIPNSEVEAWTFRGLLV
jgi:hypothetical protein